MDDPRPLTGEPLPLDLLNTEWIADGRPRDLLAEPGGPERWLASAGHAGAVADAAALRTARAAIRAALEGEPGALNAVLARGRIAERLGPGGPERVVEVDAAEHVAWLAAHALLGLLRAAPDRIRRCAGDGCVLWFHDTSRSGRRAWCSMAGCGNRAKARRHYARSRGRGAAE